MWNWLMELRRKRRHKKAEEIRRMCRIKILMEDADAFFAGYKTQAESLAYRNRMYRRLEQMSDDEILN